MKDFMLMAMEEYKYLGCVVDEYLSNMRMVEKRAKTGTMALSDWLRRCRATVGEVKGATFVRLLEMLVESVLLYGVEACSCPPHPHWDVEGSLIQWKMYRYWQQESEKLGWRGLNVVHWMDCQ